MKKTGKMDYIQSLDFVKGLSEDERVEAFAMALGMLTEEELDELILMCADIIEAVEARARCSN